MCLSNCCDNSVMEQEASKDRPFLSCAKVEAPREDLGEMLSSIEL